MKPDEKPIQARLAAQAERVERLRDAIDGLDAAERREEARGREARMEPIERVRVRARALAVSEPPRARGRDGEAERVRRVRRERALGVRERGLVLLAQEVERGEAR